MDYVESTNMNWCDHCQYLHPGPVNDRCPNKIKANLLATGGKQKEDLEAIEEFLNNLRTDIVKSNEYKKLISKIEYLVKAHNERKQNE